MLLNEFNFISYNQIGPQTMQLEDGKHMNEQILNLIKNKVERQCFMCLGEFDCGEYAPMIMCMNEHSCCAPCMQELLKNEGNKQLSCPHCQQPVNKKLVTKNRHLMTIFEIILAYKKYVASIEDELDLMRRMSNISNVDMKGSLISKNPKMVRSFIMNNQQKSPRPVNELSLFDDVPITTKSQCWAGNTEKRRQILLAYAERQKIEELKTIAKSDVPLEQVTSIRSGYGTIKKIECMEYFANLRELLLYNNHIRVIEGLNNNIRLNVLSLSYNKIEKVENIGHLRQLKRLSLQCNKIGKASAEYLALYEWRNLQSLTISFHEQSSEDNEISLMILFDGKSVGRWASLKTIYIYNSKGIGEKTRLMIKQFALKKKNPLQVYWS